MSGPVELQSPQVELAQRAVSASDRLRLFVGLMGLGLASGLHLNVVPLMTGAFVTELGMTTAEIGSLISLEILLGAVVGILLSMRMHLVPPRLAGVLANLCLLASTLAFGFVASKGALFAAATLEGLSLGVIGVCSAAAITRADRVDRVAALVSVGVTALVAGLTLPLSSAAELGGRQGLFLTVAAVVAISTLLIAALPRHRSAPIADRRGGLIGPVFSPVVFSSICLAVGSTGVWAFTERIGASLGLSTKDMGDILAGSTLLAILGGASAALIARPGRELTWAIIGVFTFGLATAAIALSGNTVFFIIAMCAQAFFYVFSAPFIIAVAISQDRSGGLATAAGGWSTLISAGAPMLAGWLVRSGQYENLAVLALAATALSVGALALVGRGIGRRNKASGAI